MQKRRDFVKSVLGLLTGISVLFSPGLRWLKNVYARAQKIILPKDTPRESLINKNPEELDTRYLEPTPLKQFDTMGVTDHKVDLHTWRLEVSGRLKSSLSLNYLQIQDLPVIEREVLLICPGFFANHGKWKGISVGKLLKQAHLERDAKEVAFSGPPGRNVKTEKFPLADVLSDKVFVAYAVNGAILPEKHGFPLRVVAEDYYGSDWVKYVYKIKVV